MFIKIFSFALEPIVCPLLVVLSEVQCANHEPSPTYTQERHAIHKSLSVTRC